MSQQYQYATKEGTLSKPFTAKSASDALSKLGGFSDVAPRSGVLRVKTPRFSRKDGSQLTETGEEKSKVDVDFGDSPFDRALSDREKQLRGSRRTPLTSKEEDDIRARARAGQQGRIDAINAMFDAEVAKIRDKGERLQGNVRGINVRAGLPGSDFATSNKEALNEKIQEEVDVKNKERVIRINAVFDLIDKNAFERIKLENEKAQENTINYLATVKELTERGREQFKELATLGVDFDFLDDDDKQSILDATGYSEAEAKFRLDKLRQEVTKPRIERIESINQITELEIDPRTDRIIGSKTYDKAELGIPTDIDPEFTTNSRTGEIFYFDKNEVRGGGTPTLIRLGSRGPSSAPSSDNDDESSDVDLTPDQRADLSQQAPPEWFKTQAESELNTEIEPTLMQSLWDEFKVEVNKPSSSGDDDDLNPF